MAKQKARRKIEKDALGEVWTEKRGAGFALVRRIRLSAGGADEVEREATEASALAHPTILRPLDVASQNGEVQLACELVDGITLRDFITAFIKNTAKLDVSHATRICIQGLDAL